MELRPVSPPSSSWFDEPAIGEIGDQLEDGRVGPVLGSAGTVQLEPGAARPGLAMLHGVGVAVQVGEDH